MKWKSATSACCPPAAPAKAIRGAKRDRDQQLADLAKALGHPARIRILRLLLAQDTCVAGAIVGRLPLAQSTVSQHLAVLRQAGLVSVCAVGRTMCYCVDPRTLDRLRSLLADLSPKDPA